MVKDFIVEINLEALKYAIIFSGYDLDSLTSRISIKRINKSYFEEIFDGKRKMFYGELKHVDNYLKRGVPFYFLKKFPVDNVLINFRKKNSLESIPPKMINMIRDYDLIREEIKLLENNNLSENKKKTLKRFESPEETAIYFRKLFNLNEDLIIKSSSSEVFEFIRANIEELGIYIFKDSFSENDVRGLNLIGNNLPEIILINSNDDKNAEIFSLLHEFGHCLLKDEELDIDKKEEINLTKVEEWCNKFAYFFMITSDVEELEKFSKSNKEELISLKTLSELSKKYKVSKHAFMYRFYLLGIINLKEYEEFKSKSPIKFKRKTKSGGGDYYRTLRSRISKKFVRLVYKNYSEGNISLKSTLDYLKIKEPFRMDNLMGGIKI